MLEEVSFSVRAGEIVGLAGLVGAGRTELARAVFGADPADEGKITVSGRTVEVRSPSDAISAGIGYLSEDRKVLSLALGMSIRANTTFAALGKFCTGPVISSRREIVAVQDCMDALAIRARHT